MARKKGVGYGNPPKEHQFRKGQSGNPKGRPPGARSFRKFFEEELERQLEVRDGSGRVKRVSPKQLIARKIVQQAISGSIKHIELVVQYDRYKDADTAFLSSLDLGL